jgi:hypothetical protein
MVTGTLLFVLSDWLIRVPMLVYVPQRRTPAARSWLLLVFFFPWVGLLLYWAIGRPYLPRRRLELQAQVSDYIRSFALNAENSMLVYDPAVVARLREVQEVYFAHADLLTLEAWRRRPRLAQVAQNLARLVDALL